MQWNGLHAHQTLPLGGHESIRSCESILPIHAGSCVSWTPSRQPQQGTNGDPRPRSGISFGLLFTKFQLQKGLFCLFPLLLQISRKSPKMTTPSPYPPNQTHAVHARSSVAVPLDTSQRITVINTHGTQVIDFWAFQLPPSPSPYSPTPLPIYLSMPHTRAGSFRLSPIQGDTLYTNIRTPILRFISDTTGGIHDTIIPACDIHRYRQLGIPEGTYHANCSDNLSLALARDCPAYCLPPSSASVPDPLNLFMNVPVAQNPGTGTSTNSTAGGSLGFAPTVSPKGGKVVLEALIDCIVVMSACPQDLVKDVNGGEPRDCHFVVES